MLPVLGTTQVPRIERLADTFKVGMIRAMWFEPFELVNGHEVA